MAVTINRLTGGSNTNNATTDFTTDAFTPTPGAEVYVAAFSASGGALDAITGGGTTWSQVTGSPVSDLSVWKSAATPAAGSVLTLTDATQDGVAWLVVEVVGGNGVVVTAESTTGTGATSATVTLPTPAAGSATLAFFTIDTLNGMTPGAGYTELGADVTMSGPATSLTGEWRSTAQTTAGVTFAAAQGAGFALEIAAAGGGSVTGSGSATATQSTASGSGTASMTGTGTATATAGTVTGAGAASTTGTGAAAATNGQASGAGTATVTGSGTATTLAGQAAGSSVAATDTGTGAATGTDATASGAATTTTDGTVAAMGAGVTATSVGEVEVAPAGPTRRHTATRLPEKHTAARLPERLTAARLPERLTARRTP